MTNKDFEVFFMLAENCIDPVGWVTFDVLNKLKLELNIQQQKSTVSDIFGDRSRE